MQVHSVSDPLLRRQAFVLVDGEFMFARAYENGDAAEKRLRDGDRGDEPFPTDPDLWPRWSETVAIDDREDGIVVEPDPRAA